MERITVISNHADIAERAAKQLRASARLTQKNSGGKRVVVQAVHDVTLRLKRGRKWRDVPHVRVLVEMPQHSKLRLEAIKQMAMTRTGGYIDVMWSNCDGLDWRKNL